MAKIYGDITDGDYIAKSDYVYIDVTGEGPYTYDFKIWRNTGAGGTRLKGENSTADRV